MRSRLLDSILLALLLLASGAARADIAQFDAANRLYESGKFDQAKQTYDQLVKTGPLSANLFYNRGNANWKLGNAGEAVADYERALALDPSHPQARANLDFVRDQTGAKIATPQWWESALLAIDPGIASVLLSLCGWAALFFLAVILLRPEGRAGPVVSLAICLLACAYAACALWEAGAQSTKAIVIAKSVPARVAPADVAPVADTLPAGSEVLAPQNHGSWTYCTLPDGIPAWIPSDALEKVRPG